jgi:hypothetical protein
VIAASLTGSKKCHNELVAKILADSYERFGAGSDLAITSHRLTRSPLPRRELRSARHDKQ